MNATKNNCPTIAVLYLFLSIAITFLMAQTPFSKSAQAADYEGFGAVTRGALAAPGGYTTYHVTNLNESGEGSLRDALSAGSRLVVFDVGGTITLTRTLNITYSYITIDGSTAPYPGITIALTPAPPTVTFQIYANARDITDIIVKYVRFDGQAYSHPDSGGGDILAISADGAYSIKNVVIDHVTALRGQDGIFDTRYDVSNMTISYCFVYDTQCCTIMNGGYTEGRNINGVSWHHNVYARCDGRQPLLQRMVKNFDAVNNVVYGWGYFGAGEGGMLIMNEDGIVNPDAEFTKNYYWADPEAPYAIGHADQGAIAFFYNGTWGTADDCEDRGNITFNDNIFPEGETEDVSYGTPTVIPAEFKPTEYDANTLGDTVVPFAGTHYPTQEEQDLLNEISKAIGGQGLFVQANAGPDQTVTDSDRNGSEEVTLDSSASSALDGTIVSFVWTEGATQIATGVKPTVTLSLGTHLITLAVTDNRGLTSTDTVTIKVLKEDEGFGELPAGCYNNVFNPAKGEKALMVLELPKQARVRLNLYNTRGNKIRELADEEKEPGTHKYYWDGKSDSGNAVGSGLYFVHIQAGDYRKTKKIVVVK